MGERCFAAHSRHTESEMRALAADAVKRASDAEETVHCASYWSEPATAPPRNDVDGNLLRYRAVESGGDGSGEPMPAHACSTRSDDAGPSTRRQ